MLEISYRPTTDFSFGKFQMTISPQTDHPVHSVFGSRVGCSGSACRMALFQFGLKAVGVYRKNNAR